MNNHFTSDAIARYLDQATSIPDAFNTLLERAPQAVLYAQAVTGDTENLNRPRRWAETTVGRSAERIFQIAAYLKSIGVTPGSKVAIISATRPEWMEADLAVLFCGAVSVSVYPSLPANEIAYILFDSGAEVVIAENQEQLAKLAAIRGATVNIPATEDRAATEAPLTIRHVLTFEATDAYDWVTPLDRLPGEDAAPQPDAWRSLKRDDLAALVYTSGTTGPPKGVMQTHGNHLANVRQAFQSGMLGPNSRVCLILPLAHSFAKMLAYLGFLSPVVLLFPAVVDRRSSRSVASSITKDMRECDAEIFPVVPRLLEKMKEGIEAIAAGKGLKARLVTVAVHAAQERFEAIRAGKRPSLGTMVRFYLTSPMRSLIQRQLFGSRFEYALSGGAKLPTKVSEFFNAIGCCALEGYGLTETAVACTVGRVGQTPIGSVGPVLAADIELRILEDGELLTRGPNIAVGYYNRPTATAASWDSEGWFHTGDLARLDEKGNLYIIGRKKEIIVTSGGKNIAPADIEAKIKEHPYVSQAVLVGDGRKYCVALVSLNPMPELAEPHLDPAVKETVWKHVERLNAGLASHETIKKIYLVPSDFTVENGLLTPTLKVKRSAVEAHYREAIDALYAN